MKKPRVEYIHWEPFAVQTESGDYLDPRESVDAYKKMMDALIETRTQLTIAMSHEDAIPTKVLVDWCTKVEKALENAGCENE